MEKMTQEEFNDKLIEYINRNNFWTEKAINQLGYSINLLTTIGIAFLGYLITNKNKFPEMHISCNAEFNLILTIYLIAIGLIIFSIGFGFLSILSRLFDLRITRHLALTRKRFLTRNKEKVLNDNRTEGLITSKIIDISNQKQFKIFKKYFKGRHEFINESDFSESKIFEKFDVLRKESKILGDYTWRCHRYQIGLFFLSVVIFAFSVFT